MINENLQNEFKLSITIWNREVEIDVVFDCFKDEYITRIQKETYGEFLNNRDNIYSISRERIWAYAHQDVDLFPDKGIPENIYKFIMPKAIYIKRDTGSQKVFGLLFHYRYREDEGLCVVFKDNAFSEIGPECIIL